jgi:hypothetical protein
MGQTVSVDVPHKLGAEEAERRVKAGVEALRQKYAQHLTALNITWSAAHADFAITVMGHALTGALEFLEDRVRVSMELPWVLALIAEKAKGMIAKHTDDMLQLPAPKKD